MARELILDVIAKKHSEDLSRLAAEFDKAASKVDGANKSLSKTTTLTQTLDKELVKARETVRQLGEEYNKTGNVDVFKNLKKAQGDVRQLEGIRKTLSNALAQAGDEGGKSFWQRFTNTVASNKVTTAIGNALAGGSGIWAAAGPAIVAGAPVVGASIGAALLTGIGLAGIGAGIAGQLHDPAVNKAVSGLGEDLNTTFDQATSNFRAPLIAAVHEVDNEILKLGPGLKRTADALAPLTVGLGRGAAGFLDKLVPSLERAAVAGRPLVELFANRLPDLGQALGNIFDAASSHAKEAGDALNLIINLSDFALNGIASSIDLLSRAFDIAKLTTGPLNTLVDLGKKGHKSGSDITDAFNQAKQSLSGFSDETARANALAQSLNKSVTDLFNSTLAVSQATGDWTHDLANLKTQLDLHDRKLNETTDAGHKNADALRNMAQEAERVREATIAQAGGENASASAVAAANAKYQAQIQQLINLAIKLGLSKDAVYALLGGYKSLANSPDIVKNIYFKTHYSTVGGSGGNANKPIPFAHGGVRKAQFGLYIPPSDPGTVLTGEPQTGGEVLAPLRGNSVARQKMLLDTAGASYGLKTVPRETMSYGGAGWRGARAAGGGQIRHTLRVADGGDVAVGTMLRHLLRTGVMTIDSEWVS